MLTGNKGEWSEIYTLFKVISDKVLYAGDKDVNAIKGLVFPILKIIRQEAEDAIQFSYEGDLVLIYGHGHEFRIPIKEFTFQAVRLLEILKSRNNSGAFSVPEIEEFIKSFKASNIKAKSSVKSDIRIVIHDERTGTNHDLGFSIKSQLGSPSTLLNAGKTTNFIYEVNGVQQTANNIKEINEMQGRSKVKDRIAVVQKQFGGLSFSCTETKVFSNNLTLIDSALPNILSEMLLLFYTSKYSKTLDLVEQISYRNPLGFDVSNSHPYYHYKVKRFLSDIALGMMPSKVWTGKLDTTGGYLVVKDDGAVLCYHIYNRNEFEDYLLNNTKFDTASTSRHDFGKLYIDGNRTYFKLNLQIRFIK